MLLKKIASCINKLSLPRIIYIYNIYIYKKKISPCSSEQKLRRKIFWTGNEKIIKKYSKNKI